MTDRRDPQAPDRRTEPRQPTPGRRESDHGTRARYQHGCGCLPCKAAEATYRAALRGRHLHGKVILGSFVDPKEAARRVRQLRLEGYPKDRIAALAGLHDPQLRFTRQRRIRLLTLLKIRRLAAYAMLEGTASDESAPA